MKSHNIANRVIPGASSQRISRRLALSSGAINEVPVALPPGRARLATKPTPTGSLLAPRTMGMVICGLLGRKSGGCSGGHNDIDLPLHKVGREILQMFVITFRVPALDDGILPLHITEFLKLTCKGDVEIGANAGVEQANRKLPRGACGEGP